MTSERVFTVLLPFCGLGAGARGFLDSRVELRGDVLRFVSLGGIDVDAAACEDFETITKSRALCADVRAIAEQMLVCLAQGAAGAWSLSSGGAVWVEHAAGGAL